MRIPIHLFINTPLDVPVCVTIYIFTASYISCFWLSHSNFSRITIIIHVIFRFKFLSISHCNVIVVLTISSYSSTIFNIYFRSSSPHLEIQIFHLERRHVIYTHYYLLRYKIVLKLGVTSKSASYEQPPIKQVFNSKF